MSAPVVEERRRAGPLRLGSAPDPAPRARPPADGSTTKAEHVLDPQTLGDHIDRLFRAAWALCGSREDAEDLVQETYARVLARPRLLRGEDDLAYLLRALRNTFISRRRASARRPRGAGADPEALEIPDPRAGAAEPPAAAEAREVFGAIAALPAEFRDALVAIDVAGLSYHEAARALRVRKGTVTSRLFRARARVAGSLSQP
jgi:RNA polymerase sigma-70 factor (ECF subfamily)